MSHFFQNGRTVTMTHAQLNARSVSKSASELKRDTRTKTMGEFYRSFCVNLFSLSARLINCTRSLLEISYSPVQNPVLHPLLDRKIMEEGVPCLFSGYKEKDIQLQKLKGTGSQDVIEIF
jgi:hypothetical protein